MKLLSAGERISGMRSSVAIGIFDGVHRGHRAVIGRAAEYAKKEGLAAAVCTFRTATVTTKGEDYRPIYSDETKCTLLEQQGVRFVYMPDFSLIKDMSARDFVRRVLADKMNAARVVCGSDFKLGKNAVCGTKELKKLCLDEGITLDVVGDISDNGVRISSADIRRLISEGSISDANRLLGHNYAITGTVMNGNHIGRRMNFPTANIIMPTGAVMPRFGVYASYALIGGRIYRGVTNIGVKPTVCESSPPLAETHFPSYSGDLYGKRLTVFLVDFIRQEMKMNGIERLKEQIQIDTECVMALKYPVSAV